jgi:arylformamidase
MTERNTDWYEQQYNPRKIVANVSDIIDGWRRRSALLRSQLSPITDLKYGPHPRETYDLFRAVNPKGTLVYVHGGYWRMHSKLETSFVAAPFLAEGHSVALINYPLCPDMALNHIRASSLAAFAHLWQNTLTSAERAHVLVAGHSAGGHLAALHAATDWVARKLPANPIQAIVSLSGVFDVQPVIRTSINADLRLTAEMAAQLNVLDDEPKTTTELLLAVGSEESDEFKRQSQALANNWKHLGPDFRIIPEANHFTIVEQFANPASDLFKATLKLLA